MVIDMLPAPELVKQDQDLKKNCHYVIVSEYICQIFGYFHRDLPYCFRIFSYSHLLGSQRPFPKINYPILAER